MNISEQIKGIFNIENTDTLIDYVDSNIFTSDHDKQNYAENQTPKFIRQNMISYLPNNSWKNSMKVFDPCSGKGVFLLEIIKKFMLGLKNKIKNPNKRYKFIVEECIYFSDINQENINICKLLIDPFNQYNLNYYIGDTLELNIQEIWNIDGFYIIIGNPPFQKKVSDKKNIAIWDRFVKKMFNMLLQKGYLSFITPPAWRSPTGNFREVFEIIKGKKLIYLNMNSLEAGHRDFNVAIPYDYYVVQNINNDNHKTDIVDVYDNKINIDLSSWEFIPFSKFDIFYKLLAKDNEETVTILQDSSTYDSRKLSKTQTEEYNYPICYTITKKKGMNKLYSNRYKDNHFIPKIIWSNGIGTYPFVDKEGKLGCSQFSYAIIDDIENLYDIKKYMETEEFINLMKCTKFNNHKYDHKTIKLFKKDFYKILI